MKIVFFGSRHVQEIVSSLNNNFELSLVVTTDKKMVEYCQKEGILYTQVLNLDSKTIDEIKKLEPDLGVVADFGLIIPKELIDIFPDEIINIHPSLLPIYRGSTPVQTAIMNGDKITGISVIKIDEELDHGPILYQEEYNIEPDDNSNQLLTDLFRRSAELLPSIIEKYMDGEIDPKQQNHDKATYTKPLKKEDGYIDSEKSPEKIKLDRLINALNPWPGVWTKFRLNPKGEEKIIKLLPGKLIQVEGKNPMKFKDFMNGYPNGKTLLEKLSLI